MDKPTVLLIGGPNGAGKSTFAPRLMRLLGIERFLNADDIARTINPDNPESAALEAGRAMLNQLADAKAAGLPFAFESTLASRGFARYFRECADAGFHTMLVYVWVSAPEVSLSRVSKRVAAGGHNVPDDDVRRRWDRSIANFFNLYMPEADQWRAWINRDEEGHQPVAGGSRESVEWVHDQAAWQAMRQAGGVK
jgi:predicted ABC-type ATPase